MVSVKSTLSKYIYMKIEIYVYEKIEKNIYMKIHFHIYMKIEDMKDDSLKTIHS